MEKFKPSFKVKTLKNLNNNQNFGFMLLSWIFLKSKLIYQKIYELKNSYYYCNCYKLT